MAASDDVSGTSQVKRRQKRRVQGEAFYVFIAQKYTEGSDKSGRYLLEILLGILFISEIRLTFVPRFTRTV
jgi:hypothetical protein